MDTSANSSITSFLNIVYVCASSALGTWAYTAWFVVYLLLFPLFLFVLFLGITKWWKQRSGNSNSENISHSDVFTFHMMALELLMTFAAMMFMYGVYTGQEQIADIGITMSTLSVSGQTYFHCLTCGERYLAVVHPITYLRLKKRGGVTIRNISIGVGWLFTFFNLTVLVVIQDILPRMIMSLLMVAIPIVPMTFCSVSALCVLIRPGPGEGGGKRKRLDQSKRSGFTTITAILGVLLVRMVQLLVFNFCFLFVGLDLCVLSITALWSSVPSSLVLPLLFLHRAGKLPTCC